MKTAQIIAVATALIAILWMASGVMAPGTEPAPVVSETQKAALQKVRIQTLNAQSFEDVITVNGRTQPTREVTLKAETEGQVNKLYKEEGAVVNTGATLAGIELREREARVEEAHKRVEQREIEYNAAQALELKGFNSKVKLAQAEADLEQARADLERAEIDLAKTNIQAPFGGVLKTQNVERGDYVNIGDTLFTIVDLNPIEIAAFLSEQALQDINPKRKVGITLLNGQNFEGKITYIAPSADPATRTFRILIQAKNPDLEIKGGMTAQIALPASTKKAYQISPAILALNDAGQLGVKHVNAENKVRFLPVKVLSSGQDAMWVGGLPETLRLITVGQNFVADGQEVIPVEEEAATP